MNDDVTLLERPESTEHFTAHADGDYADFFALARPPTKSEMIAAFDRDEIGLAETGELEPELRVAFADAIEALCAGIERADLARFKLARAGDPLGLMDGDGNSNEEPETNAPTAERAAGRGEFETFKVANVTGRDKSAEAWRSIPIVEAMIRRGQIDKDDAQDFLESAQRFYKDFVMGHRQGGLTARYGEQSGKGGTPISQQQVKYYTDKNGDQFEVMGPDERRADHHTKWIKACHAIGVYQDPVTNAPRPGRALQWMLKLICEDYLVAEEKTPTLLDAGKAYLGCKCPKQAAAAGAVLVMMSLDRLANHYGLR